jgi:hypothetical protein
MMADGEQIHSAMYPGSILGDLLSEQTEVNIRQHALEAACFVVCATAWLDPDQQAQIMKDTGCSIGPISGAAASPRSWHPTDSPASSRNLLAAFCGAASGVIDGRCR